MAVRRRFATRAFGLTFNRLFERWMFIIIPGALVLGFLCADQLQGLAAAVPSMFAFVTFTMALGCGWEPIKRVLGRPGTLLLALLLAHVLLPLIAWAMGTMAFGAYSPYTIGFVLFTIIPLGVSSVIWVGLSGGSVPLILAMVVLDSLLSPVLVPGGIHLLFGTDIHIPTMQIMSDLLVVIVLPTIAGVMLNELTHGKADQAAKPYCAPVSKLFFVAVVGLNATAIAPYVDQLKSDMLILVPLVIVLVGICYAAGYLGAAPFRDTELQVTVSYATGMRNISLGIVLAIGYFNPLTAIPVVLSILIQQPIATLHHYVLQKLNKAKAGASSPGAVR